MTESLLPLVCLFIALAPILCNGKLKVGLMLHTTFVPIYRLNLHTKIFTTNIPKQT